MTKKTPSKNKPVVGISAAAVIIIGAVLGLEGGYVNNPRDPGGATNHGVTEAVARNHGYAGHMRDLPKEKAVEIYYKDYIDKPGYTWVVDRNPALGQKLVDIGVNAGTGRASRWFQTGLNAYNRDGKDYPDLMVDGLLGPATFNAYSALARVRGETKACELMLKALEAQQGYHYLSLTKMEAFTVGWMDHRIGNVPISECGVRNAN